MQQKCLSSGLLLCILRWQTDSLSGLCVNTGAIAGGIGFVYVRVFRYMCASQGEGSMGFYIWNGKLADSSPPRETFPLFKSLCHRKLKGWCPLFYSLSSGFVFCLLIFVSLTLPYTQTHPHTCNSGNEFRCQSAAGLVGRRWLVKHWVSQRVTDLCLIMSTV